jgi:heme/copper-type cytochrome/quinol oxidase subunit 4
MRSSHPAPAHGVLAMLCLAVYVVGFFIAVPILGLIAVATAQQGDFPIAIGALVALAVVWKATGAAWRRLP